MATLLQPGTTAPKPGASTAATGPLAGMTLLTAEGQAPRAKAAVEITRNALKRIRIAMAKEGISPDAGGLRLGIQCARRLLRPQLQHPLSTRSRRERDRVFVFGDGIENPQRSQWREARPPLRRSQILPLPRWHGPRLRRDPHAPGLQLHQSELDEILRLRLQLLRVNPLLRYSSHGARPNHR